MSHRSHADAKEAAVHTTFVPTPCGTPLEIRVETPKPRPYYLADASSSEPQRKRRPKWRRFPHPRTIDVRGM